MLYNGATCICLHILASILILPFSPWNPELAYIDWHFNFFAVHLVGEVKALIQTFLFHRVLGEVKVLIQNFLFHRALGEVKI